MTSRNHAEWMETLYDWLANDGDERVCEGISEQACRETPGNFFRTLVANTLTSVGDRLASAKTTLPWLLSYLAAPGWCISLLVPIRESGSMLPQLAIGALVRRRPIRKGVWVAGSVLQGLALAGMAGASLVLHGLPAGLTLIALLILFSLARGACSVAYKDVLGKTIPKTRRGRLSGWISAIAGSSSMLIGAGLAWYMAREEALAYVAILGGGALLWFAAAAAYATIVEYPGETGGGMEGLRGSFRRLAFLRDDLPFRRFVIARALAMGSGLAAPFYVMLAREDLGEAAGFLGVFIAVEGLAALVSAPLWGYFSDRSARLVFAAACGLASLLSLSVAVWSLLDFSPAAARWFYPVAFFGLGIAHSGVRLGRKTYLVDLAEGNRRTDYVAVSNTVIGALLLASGLIGAAAAAFSAEAAILLLALAGLTGAALSLTWKEVHRGGFA